jgi:uncharacterized protein YoxC
MYELWSNLTDAQASLLSTITIILAGGLGVVLSAALFGRRVKNLETALQATERKINEVLNNSAAKVDAYNQQLAEKLGTVDEQFSATLDALGQLRNSVASLQDSADKNADDIREQLKTHWSPIAEAIEQIASDPSIHGKTRARYSKIPRRTLDPLLKVLIEEGRIDATRATEFRAAVALWNYYKNGRATLIQSEVDKMKELAIRLAPSYRP